MSQNPKKPVISELTDEELGLTVCEDLDFDLGLDDPYADDRDDDWLYDGTEGLDFSQREDQCTECFGHGTIDHDDNGDEDACHVCGGTGYFVYIP